MNPTKSNQMVEAFSKTEVLVASGRPHRPGSFRDSFS